MTGCPKAQKLAGCRGWMDSGVRREQQNAGGEGRGSASTRTRGQAMQITGEERRGKVETSAVRFASGTGKRWERVVGWGEQIVKGGTWRWRNSGGGWRYGVVDLRTPW